MGRFNILDAYSLRARLFPSLFAAGPILVAIMALVPMHRMSWIQAFSGLTVPTILYVAADIARRMGKRHELDFYKKWDGKPTVRMLRHRDGTLNSNTKAVYLTFLASKIGGLPPTPKDEAADPVTADAYYERCGAWLRENTRSTKKFAILLAENVTYGYRRNLVALKALSLVADVLLVTGVGALFIAWPPPFGSDLNFKLLFLATFGVIHGIVLLIAASEKSLKEASETYARQLLLCCEALMSPPIKGTQRTRRTDAA